MDSLSPSELYSSDSESAAYRRLSEIKESREFQEAQRFSQDWADEMRKKAAKIAEKGVKAVAGAATAVAEGKSFEEAGADLKEAAVAGLAAEVKDVGDAAKKTVVNRIAGNPAAAYTFVF
jgi:hypothetical protein